MSSEKRAIVQRDECAIDAKILLPREAETIPCVIRDLSIAGARVEVDDGASLPVRFKLGLLVAGEIIDWRDVDVRWRRQGTMGVHFVKR